MSTLKPKNHISSVHYVCGINVSSGLAREAEVNALHVLMQEKTALVISPGEQI